MRILSLITHFSHLDKWENKTDRINKIDPTWEKRSILSKTWSIMQNVENYDCLIFFYDTLLSVLFNLLYFLRFPFQPRPSLVFTTMLCDISRFNAFSPFSQQWVYEKFRWLYYAFFVRLFNKIVVHSSSEVTM